MIDNFQFFQFRHNSSFNDQYTWAYKIIASSDEEISICPECSTMQKIPKGAFDVAIEGGIEYPDILGCGAYPFLIVSTRVVNDWEKSGISNFVRYPVEVVKHEPNAPEINKFPGYFRIEPEGRCRIDLEASGLQVIKHCPKCNYLKTRPTIPKGFQVASDSWDGSAIFRDPDLYPRVIFCTRKILNIAYRFQHTNFRFEHMAGPFDPNGRGIDYLSGPPG